MRIQGFHFGFPIHIILDSSQNWNLSISDSCFVSKHQNESGIKTFLIDHEYGNSSVNVVSNKFKLSNPFKILKKSKIHSRRTYNAETSQEDGMKEPLYHNK